MKRCQAKIPGTTAFYLHGTQCGCSPTKSGPCKIKAHSAYVAYEIRTLKLRRLACVRLWNDSYALQYQQRWLNSFVVIWDEHCYCCETLTHTHSVSLSLSPTHSHKPVHLAKRACIDTAESTTCGDCPAGYTNDGAKGCKGLCVRVCMSSCRRTDVWGVFVWANWLNSVVMIRDENRCCCETHTNACPHTNMCT